MPWNVFDMEFADPGWLWMLLALPVIAAWKLIRWKKQSGVIRFALGMPSRGLSWAQLKPHLFWLGWLALACWIIAFARPRTSDVTTRTHGNEGIDIVMALDVSSSMLALDLKPNRMEALKKVAADFINKRSTDRIGLVVYAGESFTRTPLTTDHTAVLEGVKALKHGLIEDGTAIGMGLATAVNRLKESDAESRVVILLTDGENNRGAIDPMTAAGLAEEYGIRVYTIGVGTNGQAKMPVGIQNGKFIYGLREVRIDEELLHGIAERTGGNYYRATNTQSLANIYDEIDRLEKSVVEELRFTHYQEHFYPWVCAGLLLLGAEILLRSTLFRSVV